MRPCPRFGMQHQATFLGPFGLQPLRMNSHLEKEEDDGTLFLKDITEKGREPRNVVASTMIASMVIVGRKIPWITSLLPQYYWTPLFAQHPT